ncbi:MAG: FtsQ-type POTRA domain-containing protein [Bacilli bacterium]|nr:FtsQ-type POTRA domain-containing protein [Bacilli bacterium]
MGKKVKKKIPMQKKPQKVQKKKVRIKYRKVFLFLFLLLLIIYGVSKIISLPITNIYIKGTTYLKDQDIIEEAKIENYPKWIETLPFMIENKLNKNPLIAKVKVYHKNIRELHITITENTPLFYNAVKEKQILKDGKEITEKYTVPVLLNYVPDKKYKVFQKEVQEIDTNILEKISEIKYNPNDKDDERFLLSMNDGNYVYLSLTKFEKINSYLNIMLEIEKKFDQKKGILYLDSGGYFEVLEK